MKPPSPTLAQKLTSVYCEIQDSSGLSSMNRNERRTPRGRALTIAAKIKYLEAENEILKAYIESGGEDY